MQKNILILVGVLITASAASADWKSDKIWNDGLAEKAVYSATRIVYGKPRTYEAVFFTNKERHDPKTLTKLESGKGGIEVFKHNQIEDIPTPNYTYHYVTTSHLTTDRLELTRMESSSQEFCGTSFKQFQISANGKLDYFAFSYFPETGRKSGTVSNEASNEAVRITPFDALPLALRNFDFSETKPTQFLMIPPQKSNRPAAFEPVLVEAKNAGEEGDSHKVELFADGKLLATFWMSKDRFYVMTRFRGIDGQQYDLKSLARVNYWTIKGE